MSGVHETATTNSYPLKKSFFDSAFSQFKEIETPGKNILNTAMECSQQKKEYREQQRTNATVYSINYKNEKEMRRGPIYKRDLRDMN